jgi:outer membrane protein assembly factor BamB
MVHTTRCRVSDGLHAFASLVNRPIVPVVLIWVLGGAVLLHGGQVRPVNDASASRILALDPRWAVSLESAPSAAAGFDQEMAYVPVKGGELLAIALDEGAIRWRVVLATSFPPATGDGLVFAGSESSVTALEQRTGREVWKSDLGSPLSGPLYWDRGWVFASTEPGELIAIRTADGHVLWRNPLNAPLAIAPSSSDDRLYVSLNDGRLAAVGLENGQTAWTYALNETVTGLLALEEQLLVGTRANVLHSISLDRGRVRWTQKAGADVIGAPTADERSIYFVGFDNVLRALNRGNGNLRWTRNLPSRPAGGPLRAENVVFVPFATQIIGAYLAATGAEAFNIRPTGGTDSAPLGGPFLREHMRATAPRLITLSREGALQGFAPRFEAPPAPLNELPGIKVGG